MNNNNNRNNINNNSSRVNVIYIYIYKVAREVVCSRVSGRSGVRSSSCIAQEQAGSVERPH